MTGDSDVLAAESSGALRVSVPSMALHYVQLMDLPSEHAHGLQIASTASALARAGASVHLYARMHTVGDPSGLLQASTGVASTEHVTVHGIRARHKGLDGLRYRWRLRRAAGMPGTVFFGRQRRQSLELIEARAKGRCDAPVVFEFHNLDHVIAREGGRKDWERTREEERRIAAGADLCFAISEPLAEDLQVLLPGVRVVVLPDAVDTQRFAAVGAGQRIPSEGEVRAVYAGSLYPHKGIGELLGALALCTPRVHLQVLGARTPTELQRWRAQVSGDRALRGRVEFAGHVPPEEVPARMSAAHLVVLPASQESRSTRFTSPLKLFEAMALGLPIAAAGVPSYRSVLRQGETAELASDGSAAALAVAIDALVEQPDRAQSLGRAARAATSAFTWDERAKRILAEVRGLLVSP